MLIPPEAKDRPHVLPDSLLPTWSRQSDTSSSLASPTFDKPRFTSSRSVSRATTTAEDVDHLPIAAQFATARSTSSVNELGLTDENQKNVPSGVQDSPPRRQGGTQEHEVDADATIRIKRTYHYLSQGQPSGQGEDQTIKSDRHIRQSLPPPRRPSVIFDSTPFDAPYGQIHTRLPSSKPSRKSLNASVPATSPTRQSRLSSNMRKRISSVTSSSDTDHSAVFIPDDLRIVLQVIGNSILKGHLALSDALRKRYDEQYPLVRSLADIFIEHVGGCPAHASPVDLTDRLTFLLLLRQSYLFQEYTDYIVHLEKALQQLDDCLNSASTHKRRYSDVSLHGDAALGATLRVSTSPLLDRGPN